MEPCLEAPLQERIQPQLKAKGMAFGGEGGGKGFSKKGRKTLKEKLALRSSRPMKQGGEMQREFTHKHPSGMPASVHTAGTGKLDSVRHRTEEKMFWRQDFFVQEKGATWL